MSDEPNELGKLARVAFRAFYGDDDPIVFSELTPEQRKRFESVAVAIVKRQKAFVADRRELVELVAQSMLGAFGESVAAFLGKLKNIGPFMDKANAFDAILGSANDEAKRQIDRWKR